MKDLRELERILKALANKRRLAIVACLKEKGEASVGDIAEHIKLSFKATSKHLGVLYAAYVVEREQRSLQMIYKLSSTPHPLTKYISNSLE
jgi:DNA-binding transcriptional ArsR family regulator